MRWRPTGPRCEECGFDWTQPPQQAVEEALGALAGYPVAVAAAGADTPPSAPGRSWTAREYLWHVVDVLRNGCDRLWTLATDPGAPLVCWDENELARVRGYERLSVPAGLRALAEGGATWAVTARSADPGVQAEHAHLGTLTAADVVRRNAHEAVHHLADIAAGAGTPDPGDGTG